MRSESEVRRHVITTLRARPADDTLEIVKPRDEQRRALRPRSTGQKWT
jgi:hypothetical protein